METQTPTPGRSGGQRGFAAMDKERQREIAAKGGRESHRQGTAHEFTPEEARAAGRKGGQARGHNLSRGNSTREESGRGETGRKVEFANDARRDDIVRDNLIQRTDLWKPGNRVQ